MAELYKGLHLYPPYQEKDALLAGVNYGFFGFGIGAFSAAAKNAFFTNSTSPWTFITTHGATMPIYAASAGTLGFVKVAMSNYRQKNDAWNDFTAGISGGLVWGIFRRQKISTILAVSALAGSTLGIFSWSGGIGGLTTITGVDTREALKFRRESRFYPTNAIPLEDYEAALGRKTHPEDFNDIEEVMPKRLIMYTDVVGYHPPPDVKRRQDRWWQSILYPLRAKNLEERKKEEAKEEERQ